MKGKGFYITLIVLLVLLNIGTLSFLWFNRPDRMERRQHRDVAQFLTKELRLNPQQKKQYRMIREDHRMMLQQFQEKDRELHSRFFDLLLSQPHDSTVAKSLADSMSRIRQQMDLLTFRHFKNIRQILDSDQQKKFDNIFHKTLQLVMPPPPPPPPPPVK